ncbi:DUF2267 domain-containing protein [Amorphus orientalis]|uniref:DUF2267 domain-containing protein n=1 Tax=Amorphus orientalis TaxID=649198 RepID=A0AAE3VSI1_9HYPH|nr:DUF2267 domain-containing protein [Amorphus orientalis]MDQ0317326.1 hypothetical protein [Amorphus orientalis]
MDELIDRIVEKTGLDRATAKKAVSIIVTFLNRDGPPETKELINQVPGAEHMIEEKGETGRSSFLGGLGGLMGGGAMGAFNDLTAAGLDMSQIQVVVRQFVGYAREHAGDEVVDQIIQKFPGLSQFV